MQHHLYFPYKRSLADTQHCTCVATDVHISDNLHSLTLEEKQEAADTDVESLLIAHLPELAFLYPLTWLGFPAYQMRRQTILRPDSILLLIAASAFARHLRTPLLQGLLPWKLKWRTYLCI